MARVTKTYPGTIYVPKGTNRIYIEYSDKKAGKRVRIATGLHNSKEGQATAELMLKNIYYQQHLPNSGDSVSNTENTLPLNSRKEMTVQEAFDEFLQIYGANKERKTLEWYNQAFKKILFAYTDAILSHTIVEKAIVECISLESISKSSINIYLRAIQVFINFAARQGHITPRDYKAEFAVKQPRKAIQIFTPNEIQMITTAMVKQGWVELSLFIRFLAESGFRVGQALNMKWSDIEENVIFRDSKNKLRHEPFPITNAIEQILEEMKNYKTKKETVFKWVSAGSLSRDFNFILEKCGIEKNRRNFHAFRKTAATRWAAQGIPLQEVQKLLGHTHIETTNNYYVGVNMDTLRQKLELSSSENLSEI
jgi:integrase/recombinase XerD